MAKRVKTESVSPNDSVQEAGDQPLVAQMGVQFDKTLLHCVLCSAPLKAPVYRCKANHNACGSCAAKESKCRACKTHVQYKRNDGIEPFIMAAKVKCSYYEHGCRSMVTYCRLGDHEPMCPHAPCHCPDEGCNIFCSPQALHRHLKEKHKWQVTPIVYGNTGQLSLVMQSTERQRLLVATEGGERLFLLMASECRGKGGGRDVKLVCIRANTEAGWWYKSTLWALSPMDQETGNSDFVIQIAKVTSCAPRSKDADGRVLHVPSYMLHGGEIRLFLQIERLPVSQSS